MQKESQAIQLVRKQVEDQSKLLTKHRKWQSNNDFYRCKWTDVEERNALVVVDALSALSNADATMTESQAVVVTDNIIDRLAVAKDYPSEHELMIMATYVNSCRV